MDSCISELTFLLVQVNVPNCGISSSDTNKTSVCNYDILASFSVHKPATGPFEVSNDNVAVLVNQLSSYHRWYLRWCLVIPVGSPGPCCLAVRPAMQHDKKEEGASVWQVELQNVLIIQLKKNPPA